MVSEEVDGVKERATPLAKSVDQGGPVTLS